MNIRLCLLFMFFIAIQLFPTYAQTTDGIPDNCENTRAEYYQKNVFARYEPQNRNLVLVNWETGDTILILATDLDSTLIRGWSWDCRYLATATGTPERYDTIVYDTQSGQMMGSVPDAQIVPHTITWGPNAFLVVESRHGAVLWDVSRNLQYRHDTGFHTTLHRNFTELRWDSENHQLTANLAVGGKRVYDLLTGEETVLNSSNFGEIMIGGERFQCERNDNIYNTNSKYVDGLRLIYAPEGGVIALAYRNEILETIEANVQAQYVSNLSWSANCRYLLGAVKVQSSPNVYETVVWELEAKRRIGSFGNAQRIPHPITWDTAEKYLMVQTRDGAYLWNLETNERILVTDEVEQVCTSSYSCYNREPKSFYQVYWDAGRQQVIGVPVTAPSSVVMYDVNTGVETDRYSIDDVGEPIRFMTSNDSRLLAMYQPEKLTLINRNTGQRHILTTPYITPYYFTRQVAISTDNKYLVINRSRDYYVWDLTVLGQNNQPIAIYENLPLSGYSLTFINSTMIETSSGGRLDVTTGKVSGNLYYGYGAVTFDPETQTSMRFTALEGTSGYGIVNDEGYFQNQLSCPERPLYSHRNRQLSFHNTLTDATRIVADDLNQVVQMHLSPDCRTLYTAIRLVNTDLPYNETPGDVATSEYYLWTYAIFWDVESGNPVAILDHPPATRLYGFGRDYVYWSPDGQYALVRRAGYYLVDTINQIANPVQFFDTDRGTLPTYTETYWDYSRGLVYAEGFGEIFALDMRTGSEQIRFEVGNCAFSKFVGCEMGISEDSQWVFGYGTNRMSVWNIDTLVHVYLPVQSGYRTIHKAYVSPNQQYIVVGRSAIRSWTFDGEELATFGFGAKSFLSLKFIDETTIEVVIPTEEATETRHYNIVTGELLGN